MIRGILLALTGLLVYPTVTSAAGSLDQALNEIATQIVGSLPEENAPNLAISTFTHTGNTCSDLSNYVSEIMLPTVAKAGDGRLRIIARSQLSAIFRELSLVYDGTISPGAAQEIGKIAGVEAILTGNITPFGEEMMVISSLIATSDGGILGSANASFPITATIRGLVENQSAALCGFTAASGAPLDAVASAPAPPDGEAGHSDRPSPSGDTMFSDEVFEAEVTRLYYDAETGEATWVIRFRNISDATIGLSYIEDSFVASDADGELVHLGPQWVGLKICSDSIYRGCRGNDARYSTMIEPGRFSQLNFTTEGPKGLSQPAFTIGFEIVVVPDIDDQSTYAAQPVRYFDLAPAVR